MAMRIRGFWIVAAVAFVARVAIAVPTPNAQHPTPDFRLFGQTREEFAVRRAAVREAAHGALVLLHGPIEHEDVDRVRFRTDNDVMYLTGVEASDTYLALLPDGDPSGKREILFLPKVNPAMLRWVDPVPGPDEATRRTTGIESVQDVSAVWDALRPSIEKAKAVYILAPADESAKYTPNGALEDRIRKINPQASITGEASRLIHALRWRKSPGEIANLRAAIAATGNAERNAAHLIAPGVKEMAVEGVILEAFRKGGAAREGFPSIVGSGPNSTVLHHFAGGRKMRAGETVVVDIGAEYNYYSADITRTFPCGGKFTPRERELYQLVLDTQRACQNYVQPGKTTLGELHQYAVGYLRKSRLRAKDSSGTVQTMDRFFVHGLGHWLGMDVHDVGGGSTVLQPGVVFTIEPGVYVPSEGIGIRIEDDYLVTPTGAERLSAAIPSGASEVEAMMRR